MIRLAHAMILAIGLLGSCEVAKVIDSDVYLHSLTADGDGTPQLLAIKDDKNPDASVRKFGGDGAKFRAQMQEIRATAEWQQATDVVIFVHGGLNSLNGGIERATQDWARLKEGMENDPERKGCLTVYPVFINWESGAFNGYVDHLVWYRRGQSRWWGPLTAPFVLAIDIVRAIGVAPVHYFQQLTDILEQFGKVPAVTVPANWRNNVRIDDRVDLSAGVKWRDRATFWTIGMIRPATIPLAQLWLGEAYPMIERRVHTLFTTDDNLGTETSSSAPEGAIHELFVALAAKVNPPKVTILAHSMGTIVANQILVKYPKHDYRDIVYMAAACSIQDFAASVPACLRLHREARFYNLCLHPHGDRRENLTLSSMPYGSLLEWLDTFVFNPKVKLDKTLGKFNNIVSSLNLLESELLDVKDRVFIKAFGIETDHYPNCHGSFDEFAYWLRSYWDPENTDAPKRIRRGNVIVN